MLAQNLAFGPRSSRVVCTLAAGAMAVMLSSAASFAGGPTASQILATMEQQKALREQGTTASLGATRSLGGTRGLTPVAVPEGAAAAPDKIGGVAVAQAPYDKFDEPLTIDFQINFAFDSAVLDASEAPKLGELCKALSASDFVVRIIGHTDSSGTPSYNQQLSLLRAGEVARHLVEDCGIGSDRLEIMGMGERVPATPDDPYGEENRRVEFQAIG